MKKEYWLITCLIISMFIIVIINTNYLKGKGIPIEVKDYIGYNYDDLSEAIRSSGMDLKLTEDDQVIEILINREGFSIDSVQVGDSIDKIYEIYPSSWMNTRKHTIQILYGKENNYGVATHYIIYTISKENKIQSILFGKTLPIIDYESIETNQIAKEIIQGQWRSGSGHKLNFKSGIYEDNYSNNLWDKQTYRILSPNSLMIYKNKGDINEKVKLYFLVKDKKLYMFIIDSEGKPIESSLEIFVKSQ